MRLIVGLGNPGRRYAGTRHNVGFEVVDLLAKRAKVSVKRRMSRALVGEATFETEKVLFVKPQTFMNLSGQAVCDIARKLKVAPSDIIVIYDDMDLPVGRLRIRPKGSAAGHKGVLSLIECLHTNEFPRIRIGIGCSASREAIDHVLSRFSRKERRIIDEIEILAADAVETILREGIEAAMNKYNAASIEMEGQ